MKYTFAAGTRKIIRGGGEEVEMWNGPSPSERSMLKDPGQSSNDFIFRFDEDQKHQLLWRWNPHCFIWERHHPRVLNKRAIPADVAISGLDQVYIGRGSPWGNPFRIGTDGTREEVIEKYGQYLLEQDRLLARLGELENKFLVCFCAPEACHGDLLIELANPIVEAEDNQEVELDNTEQRTPSNTPGLDYAMIEACSKYFQETASQGLNRNVADAFNSGFNAGALWCGAAFADDDIPF